MELLRRLMGVLAPSGYEQELRKIIMRYMRRYVDEVYVDKLGNLICHKKGKGPKIMLAAHMDEIGLIVKHIKNDGKIYFSTIGGIETVTLLGQYVSLITPKTNILIVSLPEQLFSVFLIEFSSKLINSPLKLGILLYPT